MEVTCKHEEFQSFCNVQRLSDKEGGEVSRFHAELKIRCAKCKQDFGFKTGNRRGFSMRDATTALDDKELRIPIFPHRGLPIGIKKIGTT